MMMMSVCFPMCLNLNPETVYNYMDDVIMCCDWDPDPPTILESDFRFLLRYVFPHIRVKTVTVTTLLLFGHVTLPCGTFLFILLSEGPVLLLDCLIDTPSTRAAGLSIHTGLVYQYCLSDATFRGVTALERKFTPRCLRDIHTEGGAENWCRIPSTKVMLSICRLIDCRYSGAVVRW